MMKILLLSFFFIGLCSCSPDPAKDLSKEDTEIVLTTPSPSFDLTAKTHFYVYDSVFVLLSDSIGQARTSFDIDIINETRNQMLSRGFLELDSLGDTVNHSNDLLVLNLLRFTVENAGQLSNPGGQEGTGNPWISEGSGDWYTPGFTYVYSYQAGSVIIAMFDWVNRNQATQIPMWEAGLRSLIESDVPTNSSRAIINIERAFDQSPYLIIN